MPQVFMELFSEEIPARMQAAAAKELVSIIEQSLNALAPREIRGFYGPRRIAARAVVDSEAPAAETEIRGPKLTASAAAVDGFLRKHQAKREALVEQKGYFVLARLDIARSAESLIAENLTIALTQFRWPKSMRWGQSGGFAWVRPLRRIVCLLDQNVIPITIGPITSANVSEGHRFLAPGTFIVRSAEQWELELERRFVIADAAKRRAAIKAGLRQLTASRDIDVVMDEALLDEVTGLVEWPVARIGRIEPHHMELPPEVRELTMKANQRYFAVRHTNGTPAPWFAFISNIEAEDGGEAIVAGNERVLRARLADAEHFYALDRRHPLDFYLPKLKFMTFHTKLGSQFDRALRIANLARGIAIALGVNTEMAARAEKAGLLCKADLVTGMVGEFPELQGIMGGYYADDPVIAAAIRTHYLPRGPSDPLPGGGAIDLITADASRPQPHNEYLKPETKIGCAVALADKFDMLREFFSINEMPSGAGDPYGLRRTALGIVRILVAGNYRLNLYDWCGENVKIVEFIVERLRVQLRNEGRRHDALSAVFAVDQSFDIVRLILVTDAVLAFQATEDGSNLLAAYRRGVNILRIENAKDGPHEGAVDPSLLIDAIEISLSHSLDLSAKSIAEALLAEEYTSAMMGLANLRAPVDAFFDGVTVNADDPALRRNRLRLLARLRDVMHRIADFSKLEG